MTEMLLVIDLTRAGFAHPTFHTRSLCSYRFNREAYTEWRITRHECNPISASLDRLRQRGQTDRQGQKGTERDRRGQAKRRRKLLRLVLNLPEMGVCLVSMCVCCCERVCMVMGWREGGGGGGEGRGLSKQTWDEPETQDQPTSCRQADI